MELSLAKWWTMSSSEAEVLLQGAEPGGDPEAELAVPVPVAGEVADHARARELDAADA